MGAWGLACCFVARGLAARCVSARLNPLNRKITRGLVADSREARSLLIGLGTTRHQGRGTLGDILTYSLIPARVVSSVNPSLVCFRSMYWLDASARAAHLDPSMDVEKPRHANTQQHVGGPRTTQIPVNV